MSATPPDQVIERFLRSIRNQFYKGHEKLFFQERRMLMQAICFPARYLDDRAVKISAERYTALLTTVIRTINAHGNLSAVRSPGRYLLHAVQEHMKHHGEDYYETGKRTRNALDDVMRGLKPVGKLGKEAAAIRSGDSTVPDLVKVLAVLNATKGGRRKAPAPALQPDLFGDAKPLQKTARDSVRLSNSSQTFDNSGVSPQKVLKPTASDSILRKSLI
jgi:hypothetical protein